MPTPGPWEQPADEFRNGADFGSTGLLSPDVAWMQAADGATLTEVRTGVGGFVDIGGGDASASSTLTHNPPGAVPLWEEVQGATRVNMGGVSLAPTPPSSAELAQPHVIGFEYEGGSGALCALIDGGYTVTVDMIEGGAWGGTTVDGIDPTDLANMKGQVRLLDPSDYVFTVDTGAPQLSRWITAGDAFSRTLLGEYAVLDITNHSFILPTPADGQDPVFLTVSNYWVDGTVFATTPTATPPPGPMRLTWGPAFEIGANVRPPRYRLLYDYDAPVRQYPRDDGLVGTSRVRQYPKPRSRQGSVRQAPAGYR